MRVPPFSYMRWAKAWSGSARYDFSVSGSPSAALPPIEDPARRRRKVGIDGDPGVEALLARRYGVEREHVLFVSGSTLANFLLVSLHMEAGDRVLVETPAYENLPGLVRLLGGEVVPLPRSAADGWRVDPDRVDAAFSDGARLALLTDLHNPTGTALGGDRVEAIREAAIRHGATVLVDEVYRDFVPGPAATAYRSDRPGIVVTSSFTEVYGLGPVRAGWLFAPPDVREQAMLLLDYLTVLPAAPAARAAEELLGRIEEARAGILDRVAAARRVFEEWAEERGDVDCARPAGGLVCFPGFEGVGDTERLCEWLRDERDVLLVPGRHFGDPSRVRLGLGPPPEEMREGLDRLGEGLAREKVPG